MARLGNERAPDFAVTFGAAAITALALSIVTHEMIAFFALLLAMLAIYITGSWLLAWGTERYYDFRYGNPRTYQIDQVVAEGVGSTDVASRHQFVRPRFSRCLLGTPEIHTVLSCNL